jgi:hypothetical protein
MTINCYISDGEFVENTINSFNEIEINNIDMPINAIIEILAKFGKEITRNKKILMMEGGIYLATWLRRSNIEKFLRLNLNDKNVLEEFILTEDLFMKAQPRGMVCHWIAGNVSTLAIFSLVQSMLCKNRNIMRIPRDIIESVVDILRLFGNIEVDL